MLFPASNHKRTIMKKMLSDINLVNYLKFDNKKNQLIKSTRRDRKITLDCNV